jgi:putative oxidoreductase
LNQNILISAGILSFIASAAHVGIVIGGPSWYRFFGAGEHMAQLAEKKPLKPTLVTLSIALLLFIWGLYAWSGAGVIPQLLLLKSVLILITSVYLLRGIVGLVAPHASNHPAILSNSKEFWFWSSLICLCIGLVHHIGESIGVGRI